MKFAKVGAILDFSHAAFEGECFFDGTRIVRQALFIQAKFGARVSFASFDVAGQAAFQGATFLKEASFNRLQVGESLMFRAEPKDGVDAAAFHDTVTFNGMQIGVDASFRGVGFLGVDRSIFFDAARVEKNAIFVGCTFVSPVRFIGIQVGGQASFQGAVFKEGVSFDGATVKGRALFRGETSQHLEAAVFGGNADFRDAVIGSTAEFHCAKFLAGVNFERTQFNGSAIFMSATFEGPSVKSFGGAIFKQGAYFQNSRFAGEANFHGMSVIGEFVCSGSAFGATVDFEDGTFSNSVYFGTREGLPPSKFSDVSFAYCRFERIADFEGVVFSGKLSLREAYIRAALFGALAKDQFSQAVDARGFKYDSIEIDKMHFLKDGHGAPRLQPFDRQPYAQLEKTLRTAGYDRDADRVYLERRRVERKIKWREAKRAWVGDVLYWLLGHYGIRPFRLLVFAMLFLSVGVAVYRLPSSVKISSEVEGRKSWSVAPAISYADAARLSFRKFFPVELPIASEYEPWEKNRLSSDYTGLLRALGWLILPVAIAAITGVLRRAAR